MSPIARFRALSLFHYPFGFRWVLHEDLVRVLDERCDAVFDRCLVVVRALLSRLVGALQDSLNHRLGSALQRNDEVDGRDRLLECDSLVLLAGIPAEERI